MILTRTQSSVLETLVNAFGLGGEFRHYQAADILQTPENRTGNKLKPLVNKGFLVKKGWGHYVLVKNNKKMQNNP